MTKLKLDPESLRVESFQPDPADVEGWVPTRPACSYVDACPTRLCRAGVRAHELPPSHATICCPPTWQRTCVNTCWC